MLTTGIQGCHQQYGKCQADLEDSNNNSRNQGTQDPCRAGYQTERWVSKSAVTSDPGS